MYPLRLKPKLDYRLWGGQRLARWIGLPEPLPDDLAEIWLVYAKNAILNGDLAGKTLEEASEALGETLVGTQSVPRYGHDFPQLAKFIDANDKDWRVDMPEAQYEHLDNVTLIFVPGLLNGLLPVWIILSPKRPWSWPSSSLRLSWVWPIEAPETMAFIYSDDRHLGVNHPL